MSAPTTTSDDGVPAEVVKEFTDGLDAYISEYQDALRKRFGLPEKHAEGDILDVSPQRQQTKYSCGAAALRAVLDYYGIRRDEPYLREALGTDPQDGTDPDSVVSVAQALGLQATAREPMPLRELYAALDAGWPVMLALQAHGTPGEYRKDESGHWCVATGYDGENVFFADPAIDGGKKGYLPAKELLDRWHDKDGDGKVYRRLGIVFTRKGE